jgi:hypothetical protein
MTDDLYRLEAENRRLTSTIAELKSRLTELDFDREELRKDVDKQKQENIRWSVETYKKNQMTRINLLHHEDNLCSSAVWRPLVNVSISVFVAR